MIYLKSKPSEVEHYIAQLKLLSMSAEEQANIERILALEDLLAQTSIKELIAEDLQDENWIKETQVLIQTCRNRIGKSQLLQEHISQCHNFIVFRYIEEKLLTCRQVNAIHCDGKWLFNEVDFHGQSAKWASSRFIKSFEDSKMKEVFLQFIVDEATGLIEINHPWLYAHRDHFFSRDIFEELNLLWQKRISLSTPLAQEE